MSKYKRKKHRQEIVNIFSAGTPEEMKKAFISEMVDQRMKLEQLTSREREFEQLAKTSSDFGVFAFQIKAQHFEYELRYLAEYLYQLTNAKIEATQIVLTPKKQLQELTLGELIQEILIFERNDIRESSKIFNKVKEYRDELTHHILDHGWPLQEVASYACEGLPLVNDARRSVSVLRETVWNEVMDALFVGRQNSEEKKTP